MNHRFVYVCVVADIDSPDVPTIVPVCGIIPPRMKMRSEKEELCSPAGRSNESTGMHYFSD